MTFLLNLSPFFQTIIDLFVPTFLQVKAISLQYLVSTTFDRKKSFLGKYFDIISLYFEPSQS